MNRFFKSLIIVISIPIITLIFLEIGVRLWGYSKQYIYDPIYTPFDKTEDIPFIHKPNLVNARGRGCVIFNTDNLGLRSKNAGTTYLKKKENEYRIIIVGNSITFGNGVKRTEDTFVQVLADVLNQLQSDVKVQAFNYGVGAYSVKEMVATLQYRMLDVEPDLVIMAIIPGDFDLSRTGTVDKWGYTTNVKLSGFMSRDSIIKYLLRKLHLTYLLRDLRYRWSKEDQITQKRFLENKLPSSYSYVKQFKEITEQHKLPHILVILPSETTHMMSLSEQLTRDEITFVDLSSMINEFTSVQFRASKFDAHPSALVHKRIGEVLAEYILHEQLKPKSF